MTPARATIERVSRHSDGELYARMEANLLASWDAYAAPGSDAGVWPLQGAWAAVFEQPPERAFYNNALLARRLDALAAQIALEAVETRYEGAKIERFAVWAHESETAAREQLETRGYQIDTTTRAMAMNLDELADPGLEFVIDRPPWDGSVHLLERMEGPPGLLADIDGAPFNARTVVIDGVAVAAALAFDHAGDCGIYNVGTLPHARRRGLASSLTAAQLRAARERGCTTASLQSTEMAERLYARLGFRDLGRFVEYVPGARQALA